MKLVVIPLNFQLNYFNHGGGKTNETIQFQIDSNKNLENIAMEYIENNSTYPNHKSKIFDMTENPDLFPVDSIKSEIFVDSSTTEYNNLLNINPINVPRSGIY